MTKHRSHSAAFIPHPRHRSGDERTGLRRHALKIRGQNRVGLMRSAKPSDADRPHRHIRRALMPVELLSIALQIDLARQKFRPSAKREKGETSC